MNAEIIAIGSELLTPDRLDTNSLFLTGALNALGIGVIRKAVVGDDLSQLRDAFRSAMEHANLVVACGGLGPTEDDLTREAVCDLLGRKLLRDEGILRGLQERFRRMGRAMAEINARQAMVPEGATILPNPKGTAPGLWLEAKDRIIILLPGPPRELRAMFEQEVHPRLEKYSPDVRLFTRHLRIVGMPESEVEQRVASTYREYPEVQITILAVSGEIHLHPRVWSKNADQANRMLDDMIDRLTLALGENLYSTKGESLEEVVSGQLQLHRATIAVAESCTGGLLSTRLTNIPGSSSYFRGGVVSYSNDLKTSWVDVPQNLLETKGAVSPEVAIAMAEGIRRSASSNLGIGITGIAGPGGGTLEKPVGLVHIGIADGQGAKERAFRFIPGDRDRIRLQASNAALDMVRQYFLYASHSKG
jgi:nicotinamide-nucleotide amidase